MRCAELRRIRNSVLVLAVSIACLEAMGFLLTGKATVLSVVFLMLGFFFMSVHWGLLSKFVESLGRGEKPMMFLWGLGVPFPLILALCVVYVSCRIDIRMAVPSAAGLLSLPFAGIVYGLYNGLIGCLRSAGVKGLLS